MQRVALTGGIATGKSHVLAVFTALGVPTIDADILAREAVAPGTTGFEAVKARFGPSILDPTGALDRRKLGDIVFADAQARRDLEAIIHPAVRARAAELEASAGSDAIVVQVIPLLVETGQQDSFDLVVVVDLDPETQIGRLRERNGYSRIDAESRIAAQASRDERLAAADIVIDNTGSRAELGAQVDRLWTRLRTVTPRG